MPDLFPVTLPEMIAEVAREIEMRRSVYPRQVAAKLLSQVNADRRIAVMQAVLEKLKEPPR